MFYDSVIVTLILVVDTIGLFLLHKKEAQRQQQRIKRSVQKVLREIKNASRTKAS